jgi:hypothetical protein
MQRWFMHVLMVLNPEWRQAAWSLSDKSPGNSRLLKIDSNGIKNTFFAIAY